MTEKILQAKRFAIKAHGDQKYGNEFPYAIHLQAVESVLLRFDIVDENIRCAAWLHDTLEDTNIQYEEIELFFGKEVANIVSRLTEPKGGNRKWRHYETYPKIKELEEAVILKLADRIANVEAGGDKVKMYIKEYAFFKESLFDDKQLEITKKMWLHLNALMIDKK